MSRVTDELEGKMQAFDKNLGRTIKTMKDEFPISVQTCQKEIQSLLPKRPIRSSKSFCSSIAFCKERKICRLILNNQSFSKILQKIRNPIPKKKDLLKRFYEEIFNIISGFWQIQITEKDRYKKEFTIPFELYKWNVKPFKPKNSSSEFQHITSNIFNDYSEFSIPYINNVVVYSKILNQNFKHLKVFLKLFSRKDSAISTPKKKLFQTKICFLGHNIFNGAIIPFNNLLNFQKNFQINSKAKISCIDF